MPLTGGRSSINKTTNILNGIETPAYMGLGLDSRVRSGLYPEIEKSGRSVHNESNIINTTERSFGMPAGSSDNIYVRLSGTTGSAIQISSSSVNDIAAGTGALTIYIEGIVISDGGNTWTEVSTFSTPTILNGRTAVQIGTRTDWYRINKIWVLTSGSGDTNAGDLYISPLGQALTLGVPNANTLQAMLSGFSVSSGGYFSVASGRAFQFIIGNFYIDENKQVVIHERFYQDFRGSGNTADMSRYEVGEYFSKTLSMNYQGAAPYTEKTDIYLAVRTQNGTASNATYYVEYVPIITANQSL